VQQVFDVANLGNLARPALEIADLLLRLGRAS
jgi:hypothetical protein